MKLVVVGTGYVGLVTGACFAEFGNHVVCVDKVSDKIEALERGEMPFYEPGLEAMVERNVRAGRLRFSTDLARAVRESLVVFIAVGTPPGDDGRADLSFVKDVARSVAANLDGYKVVVTKSTVPAGTGAVIRDIIREEAGEDQPFSVASNPEFLREGSAIEDFMRPNRVVLGCEDEMATGILKDLYQPLYLIETPFVVTDVVTAELIKYASNAFLATKISYINEMADLCEEMGADVHAVAKGMGLDRRIGPKFLHPGPGYGGSCFPKDTRAIVGYAADRGVELGIVRAAIEANERRVPRMMDKIRRALDGELSGRTVTLLGLSFKPNTDDLRESPALGVLDGLLAAGAAVRAFDPVAAEAVRRTGRRGVVYCEDEYDAARDSDAVVIATEWNQFRALDIARLGEIMRQRVLIDLRNVYERDKAEQAGFSYIGVGR